ncbi:MAG: hypothetical protein K1X35_03065 [Caulobacteraceae bacterium]|nr:hypothetical protein [Caulobacteraceae bacterium]
MKLVSGAAAALLLACAASSAGAKSTVDDWAYLDGNQLYAYCTAPEESPDFYLCGGYLLGAVDTMSEFQQATKRMGMPSTVCIPANQVALGRLIDLTVAQMNAHPDKRSYPAADIVLVTMQENYPCR